MKRSLCLAIAVFTSGVLLAQRPGGRLYDPTTETTLKGTVDQVTQVSRGRFGGTHLFVKVDGATQEVALGPSAFVSSHGFSFAKGDAVEVTGSKVTRSGKEYVIAREVVKDGKTLTLRDKNGLPAWAGQKRGRKRAG
jgi:hypothetical protein